MLERTLDAGSPAAATPGPMAPVSARERIDTVDIVRGFALFGILAVNMAYFSHPIYSLLGGLHIGATPADRAVEWLIRFLADGKFYSLFSLLFGLGLALQMERAEARGAAFAPLYARRLGVLLLIGLAHAFLVWTGDILVIYALLGFVLLLFRKRSPRALLIWAGVFIALPILFMALSVASLELARFSPEATAEIERSVAETKADYAARAAQATLVYAKGDYLQITAQRARDLAFIAPFTLFFAPSILAMFLLGLYAGRRRIAQDIAGHRPFIRRAAIWGLALGLPLNLVYAATGEAASRTIPTTLTEIGVIAWGLGAPALSIGYAAALTLLAQRDRWRRRLAPLAAAGRMALSNYLLQSLVCTFIFYSYGLGLFGQVGAAAGLALTIVIYALQLPLSVWWLRRFQYGPAEWLWRSLTYGRLQPMRRADTASAA
jgi:uncharacterized protein